MKLKVIKEIEAVYVDVAFPVDDDDMAPDAPGRDRNTWAVRIILANGMIPYWPIGKKLSLWLKVRDEGVYVILDQAGNELARRECYVPHNLIPGEDGDYVDLRINEHGVIMNWPRDANLSDFEDSVLQYSGFASG